MSLFVQLDVTYITDNKIVAIDDQRAELLYVRALTFCKQNLTDGFIHKRLIGSFAPFTDQVAPGELAAELVRVGLWRAVDDGWVVEAWLDWNPHSEDIMTPSRGRELAHIRHHVNKGVVKAGCTFCDDAESEKDQVDAHVCGPQCEAQCTAQCGAALPETETETETQTETDKTYKADSKPEPLVLTDVPPAVSIDERFGEFWGIWTPKKNRAGALKAYTKALKEADHETIVTGARRYMEHQNRRPKPGEFVAATAHAATWLNNQRWDDELDSGPESAVRRTPSREGVSAVLQSGNVKPLKERISEEPF